MNQFSYQATPLGLNSFEANLINCGLAQLARADVDPADSRMSQKRYSIQFKLTKLENNPLFTPEEIALCLTALNALKSSAQPVVTLIQKLSEKKHAVDLGNLRITPSTP